MTKSSINILHVYGKHVLLKTSLLVRKSQKRFTAAATDRLVALLSLDFNRFCMFSSDISANDIVWAKQTVLSHSVICYYRNDAFRVIGKIQTERV